MSGEMRERGSSADMVLSVGMLHMKAVRHGLNNSSELGPYPAPGSKLRLVPTSGNTDADGTYQDTAGCDNSDALGRSSTRTGGLQWQYEENRSPDHNTPGAPRESPQFYGSMSHGSNPASDAGARRQRVSKNERLRRMIREKRALLPGLSGAKRETKEREIHKLERELTRHERKGSRGSFDIKKTRGMGEIYLHWRRRDKHLRSIFLNDDFSWPMPLGNVVPHGPSIAAKPNRYPRIYRELIVVSSAMFMGYGALVAFQHKLFDAYKSNSHGAHWDTNKELLKHGAVMNYIGNLAFRFLHNVFLACLSSRQRVTFSLWAMALSMCMLGFLVYWPIYSTWVPVVYMAYLLGGAAIGTFETNILSCVTPLGHDSKLWAMLGIPIGFSSMAVGGMFAAGAGLPVEWLYYITAIMSVIGVFLFVCFVPAGEYDEEDDQAERKGLNESQESQVTVRERQGFIAQMGEWRVWGPIIFWPAIARTVCMFFLTFFSSFNLYKIPTVPGDHGHDIVPIISPFGKDNTAFMRVSFYLAILNIMQLIGDTISRKLAYVLPMCNPTWYCIWSVIGGIMCYFCDPILTWIGTLFIFLANGAIYSNSVKKIDTALENSHARRLNLVAVSMWLLLGDVGSVVGSNTWQLFT